MNLTLFAVAIFLALAGALLIISHVALQVCLDDHEPPLVRAGMALGVAGVWVLFASLITGALA